VELAPLPAGAQFLNVIESIFSGAVLSKLAGIETKSPRKLRHLAAPKLISGLRLTFLLSKFCSPRKPQLLGGGIEQWRWLERFVDPRE